MFLFPLQVTVAMYLLTAVFGVEVWHRSCIFGYYLKDTLLIIVIGKEQLQPILLCCLFKYTLKLKSS